MNKKFTLILLIIIFLPFSAQAKNCTGKMLNPISDICWSCILPISIGAIPVVPGKTADTPNFPSPVCICPKAGPPYYRIGIAIGYFF